MAYILCQLPRAEHPYYIEHISTNIYSMEELCYYFYHNLYLLDETILNPKLCAWLREELGLTKLCAKLEQFFGQELGIGWFVLPVFKEINYLNQNELVKLNEQLKVFESQPKAVRMKRKGDALVQHRKYVSAIRVYTETLKITGQTGRQFAGSVYNNMGCAFANLFQMEEALDCFKQAYLELHSTQALTSYLGAVRLVCGEAVFQKEAKEADAPQEVLEKIETFLKKEQKEELPNRQQLQQWTADYHRSTGL